MDAPEQDLDVKLQGASPDLLAGFETALKPFLYRNLTDGKPRVRRNVRERELDGLVALIEPFQELPQLLDPHLGKLLPILADALLEYLRTPSQSRKQATTRALLTPMSQAICKLLYTFCKIRGEKVIVRFFSAETRHLELLLSAVEGAEVYSSHKEDGVESKTWSWEERYICLLWLSHLLLAPFDLATISSAGTGDIARPVIPNLDWPANLPGVTVRVIPLAIKYLGVAGKERDAAKALLIRISMRRDMQELGLLHALVQWAMSCLKSNTLMASSSSYYFIGLLSYLAGVLVSSLSTADMDPYLLKIFRTVQNISDEENTAFNNVHTSAIARKTVIKVLRTIGVLVLRKEYSSKGNEGITNEIVESTIGHLLDALADNDTPVRLAASKALSVITLKLDPDMASQVVEAVLESLNNNVLWENRSGNPDGPKTRDLSAVNPLEWHGLTLTLSHLLYRKSPPASSLGAILHSLLIGLTFERRSTSGSSIGTNVRDAACFGIWALARRYSTSELQSISTGTVFAAKLHNEDSSIIQVLATELVVAASSDSAGNIRRGASAALQELIGRHPDIVAEGISVVQVVDYHAVALRSRAVLEVSPSAALLSPFYEDALIQASFGWRGVGSGDATCRRTAASGVGLLASQFKARGDREPWQRISGLILKIEEQLKTLKPREIDQRHGLILSMAAAAGTLPKFLDSETVMERFWTQADYSDMETAVATILRIVQCTLQDAKTATLRRPELVSEATCRLIVAACPIIRIARVLEAFPKHATESKPGPHGSLNTEAWEHMLKADLYKRDGLEQFPPSNSPALAEIIETSTDVINASLRLSDPEALEAATAAALSLMLVCPNEEGENLIGSWTVAISEYTGNLARQPGYLFALGNVFEYAEEKGEICRLVLGKWQVAKDVESRVSLLQCLNRGKMMNAYTGEFIGMIAAGLDDYTTDARGDIGSLVRIEAAKAAGKAFTEIPRHDGHGGPTQLEKEIRIDDQWYADKEKFGNLYGRILRLAAEKLDKVRTEAQQSLAMLIRDPDQHERFANYTNSSPAYFRWLLDLQMPGTDSWLAASSLHHDHRQWSVQLFEGYVSSADSGSEGLIRTSRAALASFCASAPANREFCCAALLACMKHHLANDRVLVPTMEVLAFLFDAAVVQYSRVSFRALSLLTQRAHYKTGSVRKLEAAVKLYAGLLDVGTRAEQRAVEAKLAGMLLHPFPGVRNAVADALWVARGVGKGVDWVRAKKGEVDALRVELEGGGGR